MRLFVYDDKKKWGQRVCDEYKALKGIALFFTKSSEVPDEEDVAVFVLMMHYGLAQREYDKKLMEELSKKQKITLIPTSIEGRMFDDKIFQTKLFENWMPKTYYETDYKKAIQLVDNMKYPFISKASEGASASNLRFIINKQEALNEVEKVFSKEGITLWIKNKQKGYILWQEYIPQPDKNDWRVILIAKKYAIVNERYIKNDKLPFASGSEKRRMVKKLDNKIISLLDFSYKFAKEFNLSMICTDIVIDSDKYLVLENGPAWGMYAYPKCVWFEKTVSGWVPTKYIGDDQFKLIAKAIQNKEFD